MPPKDDSGRVQQHQLGFRRPISKPNNSILVHQHSQHCRTFIMAVVLPPDLLYSLGDTINSRSTLAALCQVSKAFNGIFTPILYRKIRIQDCELQPLLENVSKLTSESHLRFTRELHLGRNIPRFPHSESGDGLDECLEKMSELVSLEYVSNNLRCSML